MTFYTRPAMSVRPPDVAEVSSVTTQRDASGSHQHDATRGVVLLFDLCGYGIRVVASICDDVRGENNAKTWVCGQGYGVGGTAEGVIAVMPVKSQVLWDMTQRHSDVSAE